MRNPLQRKLVCALLAFGAHAHAQEVLTIPIGPLEDPEITRHLSAISSPQRQLRLPVLAKGGRAYELRTIQVIGSLTNEDAQALVRLTGSYSQYIYRMVGDRRLAEVRSRIACEPRCGRDTRLTFRRTTEGWKYLYKTERRT